MQSAHIELSSSRFLLLYFFLSQGIVAARTTSSEFDLFCFSIMEFDRRVFDEQLGEDAVLEKMGYQQGKFSSGTTSEKRVF